MKSTIYPILMFVLICLSQLANAQDFVWAKSFHGSISQSGKVSAIDAAGNVYVAGYFFGKNDFDPGMDTFNLTSEGGLDIFISKLDASGNLVWAKSVGGTTYEKVTSITLDASGNVYITGSLSGAIDFDPSKGFYYLYPSGEWFSDIFVAKFDAFGNFVWAKKMGGERAGISVEAIAVDALGNVCTTGRFQGEIDFDPGKGTFNFTTENYRSYCFISKLDSEGNFLWAKKIDIRFGKISSIAFDTSGNMSATGFFGGTVDFDPNDGVFNLSSADYEDVFILKLDASGNFVWTKQIGGTFEVYGNSIALDAAGNVYTTGSFGGTVDFNPGLGTYHLTSTGFRDVFISKLDASGNFLWAKQIMGSHIIEVSSIAINAAGSVYTTGCFYRTIYFDPPSESFNMSASGGSETFISKFNTDGKFIWAKQIKGNYNKGKSIALDSLGNVYTTGYCDGTADLDPGEGTFNTNTHGIFILKLDSYTKAIPEVASTIDLHLFPNPAKYFIFMELSNYANATADIYNMQGQHKQQIALTIPITTLDVNLLPDGFYFVRVRNSEGSVTKRFKKDNNAYR